MSARINFDAATEEREMETATLVILTVLIMLAIETAALAVFISLGEVKIGPFRAVATFQQTGAKEAPAVLIDSSLEPASNDTLEQLSGKWSVVSSAIGRLQELERRLDKAMGDSV